jgi:hypothetical protein
VDQGERQVEAPLHAAGVAAHAAIRSLGEADPPQQLIGARRALLLGQGLQRRLQAQVLTAGQQRVEGGLLQGGTDPLAHLGAFLDHVVSGNPGRTRGRRQEGRQHVHRGRLPRAIRAEEAVDLPGIDMEVDAVDGARTVLEDADQLVGFDRVLAHEDPLWQRRRRGSSSRSGCLSGPRWPGLWPSWG